MTEGSVRVIIVSEDIQQSCFVRRFLIENGIERRKIREKISPAGCGAGSAYVLREYPKELKIYRSKSYDSSIRLVICIDADKNTVLERKKQLDDECTKHSMEARREEDKIAFVIPRRNIETWLAYLRGENFNEEDEYRKHECEADCQAEVKTLVKCCQRDKFDTPPPPSLLQACTEYKSRI
jgi:hypothetical protein